MGRFSAAPLFIFLAGAVMVVVSGNGCRFPRQWQGRWYQSGLGEVEVGQSAITKKGVCHEQFHDYYLMENTDELCYMCMLIVKRHNNILQYKESYCIGKASLRSICDQIRVEAVLYTMVREPAAPVPCPFQEAYHVMYNNDTGGWCRSPMSYVQQCAGESKLQFKFRHCGHVAYTHEKDVSLQCLATWKDGSQLFMYGGFAATDTANKEAVYRCFIYQLLGTVVYVAVSADATCRGLRSQQDGPLVMELTKDVYGWQSPQCDFPDWMRQTSSWRDLSSRHQFDFNDAGDVLTMSYRRRADIQLHTRASFRCLRSRTNDSANHAGGDVIMLTHVLDDCAVKMQCLRLIRRDHQVIEIQRGSFIENQHSETCDEEQFAASNRQLLFPVGMRPSPCPFTGRYMTTLDQAGCQMELRSACERSNSLQLFSSCKHHPLAEMKCLSSWNEGSKVFILAQSSRENRRITNCFSIQNQGKSWLHMTPDHQCNLGVSHIITHNSGSYSFRSNLEKCENPEPAADDSRVKLRPTEDPGGGKTRNSPKSKTEKKPRVTSDISALQAKDSATAASASSVLLTCCLSLLVLFALR